MQHINLADARLLPPRPALSGALLLALLLAATLGVALHGGIEQRRLARALAAGAEPLPATDASEPPGAAGAAPELQQRIAKRRALLDSLDAAQALLPDAAGSLERLLAALPETLWLTEVELHGAQGLRITGGTLDVAALGTFAERLAQVPALRGMPIETLRLSLDAATPPSGAGEATATLPPSHRFVLASAGATAQEAPR
ncbi:MAG: PilN domain-containing protein [Burkholderiaceae bacterium]|nr:PilN domain-containing protein [Burkholderiaceae bacterium]